MTPDEVVAELQSVVATLTASQATHVDLINKANADIATAQAQIASDQAQVAAQQALVGEYQTSIDDLNALIAKLTPP